MNRDLKLFVFWQDSDTRRWHVVGRLTKTNGLYSFVYTNGARASERFIPFGRMTKLHEEYRSEELFPLFRNRILQNSRPDYPDYLDWLGVDEPNPDPLLLLARSGGIKETDTLRVYAEPTPDEAARYHVKFFSHGIRYIIDTAVGRIKSLSTGDVLYPMHDMQNPWDEHALALRTDDPATLVGYCPRYFARDFRKLIFRRRRESHFRVVRVNHDAPIEYRLLCEFTSPWPSRFKAFSDYEYKPIAKRVGKTRKKANSSSDSGRVRIA